MKTFWDFDGRVTAPLHGSQAPMSIISAVAAPILSRPFRCLRWSCTRKMIRLSTRIAFPRQQPYLTVLPWNSI